MKGTGIHGKASCIIHDKASCIIHLRHKALNSTAALYDTQVRIQLQHPLVSAAAHHDVGIHATSMLVSMLLRCHTACLQTNVAVVQAFEELVAQILATPTLVGSAGGMGGGGVQLGGQASGTGASSCSC